MTDERTDRPSDKTTDSSESAGAPLPEESGSAAGTEEERGGDPGTDSPESGNDNIREGNVDGLMGGPNQER